MRQAGSGIASPSALIHSGYARRSVLMAGRSAPRRQSSQASVASTWALEGCMRSSSAASAKRSIRSHCRTRVREGSAICTGPGMGGADAGCVDEAPVRTASSASAARSPW